MRAPMMFRTLRRHRMMALLIVAQVVFALVVLVNVGGLLYRQMVPVLAATGVPAGEVLITRQIPAADAGLSKWPHARIRSAEQAVRSMPGVRAVNAGLGAPFAADGMWLKAEPTTVKGNRSVKADLFAGDQLVQALGLHLLRGRGFTPGDYARGGIRAIFDGTRAALITRSLAHRLFPGSGGAVGRSIWLFSGAHANRVPLRIVGVTGDTLRSRVIGSGGGVHAVVLLPYQLDDVRSVAFTIRVAPAQRDDVQKHLPAVLGAELGIHNAGAVKTRRYGSARDAVLHGNRVAAWMLAAVMATVIVVVGLGITGLSGFWVQKRIRDIGIRRALGARRADILLHHHLENALVVGAGAVLGIGLGMLASVWLSLHFQMTAPPPMAWGVGALALVALGQLAVLGPALRAAAVPPVVATRAT